MELPARLLPPGPARIACLDGIESLPELPWSAAVVDLEQELTIGEADLDDPARRWLALASRLAPGGRLLIRLPTALLAAGSARDQLEMALAEAGFAVRRQDDVWLLASATPYRIRGATEEDHEAIAALFERSFFHRRSREHWLWQYLHNPNLEEPQIALAIADGGELVAHYAGYPVCFDRFARGQRSSFLAHQIGDTMTAPEARSVGRGPTSLLARSAYYFFARYSRGKTAFVYGFNVGNIQKFSLRYFNGEYIADAPYWERPAARPLPAARLSRWRRRPLYQGRTTPAPNAAWWQLYLGSAPAYGSLVRRSLPYLKWRYAERPDFDYTFVEVAKGRRLVAWGVFRRDGERLLLGDLLVHPEHAAGALRELLATALAEPVGQGATLVVAWCSERPGFLAEALCQVGFERAPEPQGLGMICQPLDDPAAPEWLRQELFFTMGDGDLF